MVTCSRVAGTGGSILTVAERPLNTGVFRGGNARPRDYCKSETRARSEKRAGPAGKWGGKRIFPFFFSFSISGRLRLFVIFHTVRAAVTPAFRPPPPPRRVSRFGANRTDVSPTAYKPPRISSGGFIGPPKRPRKIDNVSLWSFGLCVDERPARYDRRSRARDITTPAPVNGAHVRFGTNHVNGFNSDHNGILQSYCHNNIPFFKRGF